ncbi:hypothetical protein KG091_08540 [Carnobacteriaceae bacterium zg-ZUI78]|nr:hypothetical protein [Carnobacteriaceae bacterium zg-ZUI78]
MTTCDVKMNEFEKNYTYKGFKEEQFRPISNKFIELHGSHVSEDNNNAVIKIAGSQLLETRYGYGFIIDAHHVVFIKHWQLWGKSRQEDAYLINLNREYFKIKEWGDFSDTFSDNSDIKTFDDIVSLARAQEVFYNENKKSFNF